MKNPCKPFSANLPLSRKSKFQPFWPKMAFTDQKPDHFWPKLTKMIYFDHFPPPKAAVFRGRRPRSTDQNFKFWPNSTVSDIFRRRRRRCPVPTDEIAPVGTGIPRWFGRHISPPRPSAAVFGPRGRAGARRVTEVRRRTPASVDPGHPNGQSGTPPTAEKRSFFGRFSIDFRPSTQKIFVLRGIQPISVKMKKGFPRLILGQNRLFLTIFGQKFQVWQNLAFTYSADARWYIKPTFSIFILKTVQNDRLGSPFRKVENPEKRYGKNRFLPG